MTVPSSLSLYIHIPFCSSRCSYCAFSVLTLNDRSWQEPYTEHLIKEIHYWSQQNPQTALRTLYFGGGTPSLLAPDLLQKIFLTLREYFSLHSLEECTLEANPEHITQAQLDHWQTLGVTRISMGVQALNDRVLTKIGRHHTSATILSALSLLSHSPLSVSIDLILGLPSHGIQEFSTELDTLLSFPLDHLSAYFLSIEPGADYGVRPPLDLPPEEEILLQHEYLRDRLTQYGMSPYEVSNWALPGKHSLHNLAYWQHQPYLGFGVGAHSFFKGRRFAHPQNVNLYFSRDFPVVEDLPPLTSEELFSEFVMLRLRTREGIPLDLLHSLYPESASLLLERTAPLTEQGLLLVDKNGITLTEKGQLVLNWVTSQLLL